jgi:hypothetical protein
MTLLDSLIKLTFLSFFKCSNLISLPKSLKLRSLEDLQLKYCSRLENFPEIECKMERLRWIELNGIAVKELPSFPIYFTGLSGLVVEDCENLIHLPSSFLQLQHLDYLCVQGCPKLSTNVRDERQFMLSIVSTEESRDLFLSPPVPNSSIFDFGCSSAGFPALTQLSLDKIYFFVILFPSTSECLNLSWSKIVSLPAWIKRFVRLRELRLFECQQLQEILELPASIKRKSIQYKSVASVRVD